MTVTINGSTGIVGATWTTAGRPSSPAVGQRGFNTTTNAAEIYNGAQWNPMSNGFSATGGTITTADGYTIHTFLSSGTFTPAFVGEVDYLVVAGGGSGGKGNGGGGGAGAFLTATNFAVAATGLTVTVGTGGASTSSGNGNAGVNSVFSSITALGGGLGGGAGAVGGNGGSGGGGGNDGGGSDAGGTSGTGGNAGGSNGGVTGSPWPGGGGGGAGAVGANAAGTTAGAGGAGLASSYSGASVSYAGGGGGGASSGTAGTASFGGGAGGLGGSGAAGAGTANTGGGGGGTSGANSGAGGSGIVIIRYRTAGEQVILPTVGTVGTVASVNMLQTRTQGDYVASPTGNGTIVTPLNITFTPKKAGNKVILEFTVNGEGSHEVGWIATRNDVNLPDTTDASNNMWAVITAGSYDNDISTTPNTRSIRILDLNTLSVETTYKVLVRSSYSSGTYTYRLNRSHGSAGADYAESLLSVVTATEIWT